jgi:hypothetical protein
MTVAACNKVGSVSGKYHSQTDPNAHIVLMPDGTCERDDVACTYTLKGNDVTLTMKLMGLVFHGTIDGKELTLKERNIVGGENTTVFTKE